MDTMISTPMRRAAEAWAREVFGREPATVTEVERITGSDGSIRSDVAVCCDDMGSTSVRVHCLVTLEPDGQISCFSRDELGEV